MPLPVLSRVPQGSILGPLFFIIFFNDISSLLPSFSSNLILYADDILLLHPANSPSDITCINSQLHEIFSWLSSKSLQINTHKSKYILFSHCPQSYFNTFPPVQISNSKIERVFSFKYLGLFLKPNLSWSLHITSICNKAKRVLGLIYRQFYKHCPHSTLMTLYKTLVRPMLEYCSIVWDPSSNLASASLESVQFFVLKLISKSWSSSYSTLLSTLKLPTLRHRRKKGKSL